MFVDFNILNQLGSPSINSNTFANRPAAGQTGRLFVSTDTFEIYRDNGTGWDLIGGPGSSTVTGSGTAGTIPLWTGTNAIGNSDLRQLSSEALILNSATNDWPTSQIDNDAGRILLTSVTNNPTLICWGKNAFGSGNEQGTIVLGNVTALGTTTIGGAFIDGFIENNTDGAGSFRIRTTNTSGNEATALTINSSQISTFTNNVIVNSPGSIGIRTATPGAALDIHSTGIIAQLNSTSATANSLLAFQRSGSGLWRIGDNYNGGSNFFEIHNTALANNAIQIDATTNKSIFTSVQNYVSGLARANYFDYTLNLPNGTTISSPNAVTTLGSTLNLNIAGSATLPNGARSGMDVFNGVNFTSAGTFTINQASTIRAFSNLTSGWAFNGSAVGTITHLAGLRVLFPTNSGSAINVTDNYALLINNQNANTGTITYTNRWGIYQEGASDLNYFAGNSLFGTTTNVGAKIAISGYMYISNRPLAQIVFNSTGTYYGQIQNDAGDKWSFARNTVNDGTLGTPIMTWQATNIRVGINTDSPNSIFEIKNTGTGTKSIAAAFRDSSSDGNGLEIYNENGLSSIYSTYYTGAGSNQDLGFYTTTSAGAQNQVMRLTSTQRVGIGTGAPTSKVDIYEALTNTECYLSVRNNRSRNAAVRTQTTLGDYYIGTGIGTDLNRFMLYDANSGQYRFIVTDSGNFLIGTTTDLGQKLQVNGDIKIGYTKTASGNTGSINNATATTMFAITGGLGLWLVVCCLPAGNGSPSLYTAFATIAVDGLTTPRIVSNDGALLTITLSGTNVQVTQSSGGTQAGGVDWVYQKIG